MRILHRLRGELSEQMTKGKMKGSNRSSWNAERHSIKTKGRSSCHCDHGTAMKIMASQIVLACEQFFYSFISHTAAVFCHSAYSVLGSGCSNAVQNTQMMPLLLQVRAVC